MASGAFPACGASRKGYRGALIDAYATCFGREALTVVDYDRELTARGTTLQAFQEFLGLPADARLPVDGYFQNQSRGQRRQDSTDGDR